MEPPTPPPGAEESPDGISQGAINNSGRRMWTGGGLESGQNKRFEAGDVEGGMDFKGAGQLETDGYRVDDFDNREGFNEMRSQRAGLHP